LAWQLAHEPRRWQKAALKEWELNKRGIVEVVTGGGKTVFAFLCLVRAIEDWPDLRTLIVVPSVSLLDQWVLALQEELGVSPSEIGELGGGETPNPTSKIVVAVINSARTFSESFAFEGPTMLIVDECHRAGSPENARALRGEFVATLGLSATPEREYDEGFSDWVEPALGGIIYRYGYVEAASDRVIVDFDLVNVEVPMTGEELETYQKLSKRIAQLMSKDADEEALKRVLIARATVVNTMVFRVPAAVRLMDFHRNERAIVFHERVREATVIHDALRRRGHNSVLYHSGIEPAVRRENLRQFRRGIYDVLVCCRALDEGMNAPETSIAIIASSTASARQRVQRLGRILRPAPGKEKATVYTLFGTTEERDRLSNEARRLENVGDVRWRRLAIPAHDTR
jgi:superfamily II DNA or RNA helicase